MTEAKVKQALLEAGHDVDATLAWASEPNRHLLTIDDERYPALLSEITDAPPLFFVHGELESFDAPILAIVGSRNPTAGGVQNAAAFAEELGRAGFVIASGLAQGIDTAAHEGALRAGARTLAFLGHGIDRVYPAANRDLAHRIAKQGALVSEFPLGLSPHRELFPQRNRLISGCSMGTLVIEAARKSGSLITARLSSEQGREVFAIPGSIHNALSRGCHQLIRQGAKLVESAEDIVSELGSIGEYLMQNESTNETKRQLSGHRDDEYKSLIRIIGYDPVSPDDIVSQSGLTIDKVSSMLLILELEGEVEALQGGLYSRARGSDSVSDTREQPLA